MATKVYSMGEVAKHNKDGDAWVVIDGGVYDVSTFAEMHPGGEQLLLQYAGQDVTEDFFDLHQAKVLCRYSKLRIGDLAGAKPSVLGTQNVPGDFCKVPYAENSAMMGWHSPYYNESHHALRKAVRTFYESEVAEEARLNNAAGEAPSQAMFLKLGQAGILAAMLGPGPWIDQFPLLNGLVKAKDFDYFHEAVLHEERYRLGVPGYSDGTYLLLSFCISLVFLCYSFLIFLLSSFILLHHLSSLLQGPSVW